MEEKIRVFDSPEGELRYTAAYEAVLRLWPVPYEELMVPTRFGKTHVITGGNPGATPLLLLSSSGGGCVQWYLNVGPLSARFRTYSVDLIGEVNKSILTGKIGSPRDFADWFADLLDGLNIDKVYMVGNSLGGFLTLNAAYHLPNRLEKIVLISPAATFTQMWAWYVHLFVPAHMVAPIFRSKKIVLDSYEWLWQGFPMDEEFRNLRNLTKFVAYPRYRISRNKVLPRVFTGKQLRAIRTPTLLLIGDREVIYKPEKAIRRATRLIRALEALIVPDANHNAQLTNPGFVNEKILDFFS